MRNKSKKHSEIGSTCDDGVLSDILGGIPAATATGAAVFTVVIVFGLGVSTTDGILTTEGVVVTTFGVVAFGGRGTPCSCSSAL